MEDQMIGMAVWFFGLLIILVMLSMTKLVSVNHAVVCVTFGRRFTRILKEGVNFILPWEWTLTYNWTYTDQRYVTRHVRGTELRVQGASQIDLVPIECETADNQVASVDTLLVYRVTDPHKTMFVANDPLNLLCQQVIKHARTLVARIKREDLKRDEADIGVDICKLIAREWTPLYGLALESCEIQCISFDEDTLRRRRQFRDGLSPSERSKIEQAHALPTSRPFFNL
jgi:regulator of protease activity HflC (stomatin/prohibitin superfamily)